MRSLRGHFLLLYVLLAVLAGIIVPASGVWLSMKAFKNYQIQRRHEDLESLINSLNEIFNEEHSWSHRRLMDVLRPAPQWGGMTIKLFDLAGNEVFTLQPNQYHHV